jgi:hypothetical protein
VVGWNGSKGRWFRQVKGDVERSVHYEGHGCQVTGRKYGRFTMDVLVHLGKRLSIKLTDGMLDLIGQVGFIWVIGGGESIKDIRWGSTRKDGVRGASSIPEI